MENTPVPRAAKQQLRVDCDPKLTAHYQIGAAAIKKKPQIGRQQSSGQLGRNHFISNHPFLRRTVGRAIPIVCELFRWQRSLFENPADAFGTGAYVFGMSAVKSARGRRLKIGKRMCVNVPPVPRRNG